MPTSYNLVRLQHNPFQKDCVEWTLKPWWLSISLDIPQNCASSTKGTVLLSTEPFVEVRGFWRPVAVRVWKGFYGWSESLGFILSHLWGKNGKEMVAQSKKHQENEQHNSLHQWTWGIIHVLMTSLIPSMHNSSTIVVVTHLLNSSGLIFPRYFMTRVK